MTITWCITWLEYDGHVTRTSHWWSWGRGWQTRRESTGTWGRCWGGQWLRRREPSRGLPLADSQLWTAPTSSPSPPPPVWVWGERGRKEEREVERGVLKMRKTDRDKERSSTEYSWRPTGGEREVKINVPRRSESKNKWRKSKLTFCFLEISLDRALEESRIWMAVSSSRIFPSDEERVSRILSSISFSCFLLVADCRMRALLSSSSSGLWGGQRYTQRSKPSRVGLYSDLSLATTMPSSWSSRPSGVIMKLRRVTFVESSGR